jgi:hypothetical protein
MGPGKLGEGSVVVALNAIGCIVDEQSIHVNHVTHKPHTTQYSDWKHTDTCPCGWGHNQGCRNTAGPHKIRRILAVYRAKYAGYTAN